MKSSPIYIAICFDRHMETAALVLLASLRRFAKTTRPIRVYAITDGISGETERHARELNDHAFEVEFIKATNTYMDLPSREHIGVGTYLRFLIPDLLAQHDKVLYLDVDVLACCDLADLYDTDVSGHPLAAVPDFSQICSGLTWRRWRIEYEGREYTFADYARRVLEVAVSGRRPYFNAGVLVLNLEIWRQTQLAARTLDYLRGKPALRFLDQDALNHCVGPDYVRLDLRWNAFAVHACPIRMLPFDHWSPRGIDWRTTRSVWRSDPWIIHYAGATKPWLPTDQPTPLDDRWWEVAGTLRAFPEIKAAYVESCEAAGVSPDI